MVENGAIGGAEPSGCGPRQTFVQDIFGYLPRADQRRWAEAYIHGLLITPGRKTVRRMADTIGGTPAASQSLHQFVNASPWEWSPARAALIRRIEQRGPIVAWAITAVVAPKRGDRSVGVHRRFVPSIGRIVNCQLSVGLFTLTDHGCLPVDWRLHLPGRWAQDDQLRKRARIRGAHDSRPLWAEVLDLVDSRIARGGRKPAPLIVDVPEMTETGSFLRGLSERNQAFLVAVPHGLVGRVAARLSQQHLRADAAALGSHPASRSRRSGASERASTEVALDAAIEIPRRPPGPASLQPLPTVVWLRNAPQPYRLMAERDPERDQQIRTWLTNFPHARTAELQRLFRKFHNAREEAMIALSAQYGLLDFEGRSFPGWHHHVTLVSAAYALSRLPRKTEFSLRAQIGSAS